MYYGITCCEDNHIQRDDFSGFEFDTIFDDGLNCVPFKTDVGSIQRFQITRIDDDAFATRCCTFNLNPRTMESITGNSP